MTNLEQTLAELFGTDLSKQDLITALDDLATFDRTGELPTGRVQQLRDQLAQADGLAHAPVLTPEQYVGFVRVHVFKLAARLWHDAQSQPAAKSETILSPGAQLAALLVLRRANFVQEGLSKLAKTNFLGLGDMWATAGAAAKAPAEIGTDEESFKAHQDVCTALAPYFHDTVISILRAVSLPFGKSTADLKGGSGGVEAAIAWITTAINGRLDLRQ
ncbi:hypothetical protein [Paraburkholderia youngii]|uniref:hypothetical protein n=1 Tax=Paraburkholderia youngii TaxID=2782701 RepID=UPI003D1C284A